MVGSYTNVFGGSNIYPSDVSFNYIEMTVDTTLVWPLDANVNVPVAASIIDVQANNSGLKLIMPHADLTSTGQTCLINNVYSNQFTVADSSGNTICAPASGEIWQIYITDNTTAAGLWQAFQYGAGVSVANAASLAGAGLKAVSTTLNQSMPVLNFNTDYTTGSNDRASLLLWTGGVGILTLPNPAAQSDWFINVRNQGSGVLTITPPGSALIDGGLAKNLSPTESCIVVCDGTAFYSIGFGQNVNFAFDYTSIALPSTGVATYTLSTAEQNRIAYNFTGALTGDIAIIVPPTVQQYWVDNQTTGSYSLTVRTAAGTGYAVPQNSRAILYCDGTNVVNAATAGISTPISIANGGTGATTASGARINLGGGSTGIAVFTSTTQAAGQAALGATLVGSALFTSPASIASISTLIGGSGYVNNNYTAVPLTGGSGTGATANITVTGTSVTTVTIVNTGSGYLPSDVLSASNLNLGGTGSGFSITVASVTASAARTTLDVYSKAETDAVANNASIVFAVSLG